MKKILLCLFVVIISLISISYGDDFEIIPKSNSGGQVEKSVSEVGKDGGKVWQNYNDQAKKMNSLDNVGDQIASGIMTWDTLIHYVIYLIRFISQIGLLAGGVMIIYAGYLYATTIFGGDPSKGKTALKDAIIGILIVSFSYAIMKLLTAAFLT